MITYEKKTKSPAFFIASAVFCLMVSGFFLLTDGGSSGNNSLQVNRMKEVTRKVEGNAPPGLDIMDLKQEEREVLEQEIGKEKEVSARALLRGILKKKDEIRELKKAIARIESLLPSPHIAKKGENHYRIALKFLVEEKGVEKERAVKMLLQTALLEELAEGFKVWNFYTGEEYGTSVTRGDARVSPYAFVRSAKKKLMDDRDRVMSERDQLAENIKSLEEKRAEVITQLDRVSREKENLTARVSDLHTRVNSMFYRLDLQKNLKKKGILKSGFLTSLKLEDVSPQHFDRSIDLTFADELVITAADLGVQEIEDVILYPRFYKKGTSYRVFITPNKKHALLTLMDKPQFRSERVVIAVK